jgi:SAM-dependent methyltransferase
MKGAPVEDSLKYPGKDLEAMSFAVKYHQWILDECRPYLGETVAEVGAGSGSVSRMLLDRGVQHLSAFEPSAEMFPRLEREVRGDARVRAINDFFSANGHGPFDSIIYVNVLEHIEHDREELATAFAALRPGGHLIVFVPALMWLYGRVDKEIGHFRRYTRPGLRQAAIDAGFIVERIRYFDVAGILPWYVNFVLLGNSFSAGSVALYDNLVVPVMRRVEGVFTPPIGKNVFLIARKPAAAG